MSLQAFFFHDFPNAHIPEILKELYTDAVYRPYLEHKRDLVMLDVGANVGLFSYYAAPFAQKIYAVEPSAVHQRALEMMIGFNQLTEKVIPVQKALSHENGTAQFFHNGNVTMYSLKEEVNSLPEEVETVETITFDKLFEDLGLDHVDFMKIDIEGAEAEVFGSEGFEKVKEKIDIIMGEFHTWSGVQPRQFMTYFTDRGFTFEWLNKTEATIFIAQRIR